MTRVAWLVPILLLFAAAVALSGRKADGPLVATSTPHRQVPHAKGDGALLHNNWTLNPVGYHTPVQDMPMGMLATPDGQKVVVATMGWRPHRLHLLPIDRTRSFPGLPLGEGDQRVSTVVEVDASLPNIWRGMAWGQGEDANILYVSSGPRGQVWRVAYEPAGVGLRVIEPLEIEGFVGGKPGTRYVGALAILPDNQILVVDEAADRGDDKGDLLVLADRTSGRVLGKRVLGADACAMAIHANRAFVADYGTGKLTVVSLPSLEVVKRITVGAQPNALEVDSRHQRLFCANTGSDTVSVVDLGSLEVRHTVRTAMFPRAPLGSIPNALALSPDGDTLYVSNGGNNNLAVVAMPDGEDPQVVGFVPTGRYPVSVLAEPGGNWLMVGVGKGLRSAPNDRLGPDQLGVRSNQVPGQKYGLKRDRDLVHAYIMSTLEGFATKIRVPNAAMLREYTEIAKASTPYRDELLARASGRVKGSVLPASHTQSSPIEHVLYIIKENRTYDQVLGDDPRGNGDPNLVLFGEHVTPNTHRLAREFVLLDNTYCDGEVSQDGWEWTCAANDSDWNLKAYMIGYSGKPAPPGSREMIRPAGGYLWELAGKHGRTYYSYGAKTFGGLKSPTWNGNFSQAFDDARGKGARDYEKADIFVDDLRKAEQSGQWHNLMLMSLPEDHTSGTSPGAFTPYAQVASNDWAVGKVVEAVTKSRFWAKTAIFIIQDDAQNGPDHVDAHRTVCLVVSPYTKRGSVDSTMYTTTSVVRSIELLLGLPPMSQYDAAATPMFACFTGKPNTQPYRAVVPRVDLQARNPKDAPMARVSEGLDFSDVDLADFSTLNQILWASCRPGEPYPGTNHTYLVAR